jgi:hypothetical protein
MKRLSGIAVAILVTVAASPSFAEDKLLGEISGRALAAIEAAKPSFRRWSAGKGLNYTVSVAEMDDALSVDFCLRKSTVTFVDDDKNAGAWPGCMGYSVQLDKKTLKVISASGRRD